jgi:hypothetical protein
LPQLWPFQPLGMPRVPRGYERQSSTTTESLAQAVAAMRQTPAKTATNARADIVKSWRKVQPPLAIFAFSLFSYFPAIDYRLTKLIRIQTTPRKNLPVSGRASRSHQANSQQCQQISPRV